MRIRNLHPAIRLLASLLFGLSVLAFFGLVSGEMASHYFEGVAERTVRQAFREDAGSADGAGYEAVCRNSEFERERSIECDPIRVRAERSLRSTSCSGQGLSRLLGKRLKCVAKFTDGARLSIQVSLGLGRHHLEIVLPFLEADAERS
jgi:hypothetical protein